MMIRHCVSCVARVSFAGSRWCSSTIPESKRKRPQVASEGLMSNVSAPSAPKTSEEATQTEYTMDEVYRRLDQTAAVLEKQGVDGEKFNPEAPDADALLQKSYKKYKEVDAQQSRIADEDGLFSMTPSGIKAEPALAAKVFWKKVDVKHLEGPWWGVTLDGRRVRFFESDDYLALPSEELALAVAHEWAEQVGVVNRFTMPLSDVVSGAHQVQPDGVENRLNYALEFFKHDHMFFREDNVREEQDELIEPILEWADRFYDITTPRVQGIARVVMDHNDIDKMRQALQTMRLNKYQAVCLTVLCQYTSSLLLPLAVINRVVPLTRLLEINRIEDQHNIRTTTEIKGYHDIRESDATVKIAACYTAMLFTRNVPPHDCFAPPQLLRA